MLNVLVHTCTCNKKRFSSVINLTIINKLQVKCCKKKCAVIWIAAEANKNHKMSLRAMKTFIRKTMGKSYTHAGYTLGLTIKLLVTVPSCSTVFFAMIIFTCSLGDEIDVNRSRWKNQRLFIWIIDYVRVKIANMWLLASFNRLSSTSYPYQNL